MPYMPCISVLTGKTACSSRSTDSTSDAVVAPMAQLVYPFALMICKQWRCSWRSVAWKAHTVAVKNWGPAPMPGRLTSLAL